jgi:F-type H+-transporting ATPase subunit delta
MSTYKVSYRYASSLLNSVIDKNVFDAVSDDIRLISSILEANRQLLIALSSPIIKPNLKLTVLESIFKSRVNIETMNFLRFLIEKKREDLLGDIAKIFLVLRDEKLGIVNVKVKTIVDFTHDQADQFKNNLEKLLQKKVRLNFNVDPNVIGGFIAQVGDTVYDASLKHQLELLKKQFLIGGSSLN